MRRRGKVVGIVLLGVGLGGTALYLTDYRGGSSTAPPPTSYVEAASIKLETGQPIQLRVTRCDLGGAEGRLILKVYGEVANLGQEEIARRQYSFAVRDGFGRLYADETPAENPDANAFSLSPGEKRAFTFKYMLEPISVRSSLELVALPDGSETNRLLQLKTSEPWEATPREGEWRVFREARWRP